MSQFYVGVTAGALPPSVPTQFNADTGSAIPVGNILNILGDFTPAGTTPVSTTGAGNTITTLVQLASAVDSLVPDPTPFSGLASFNDDQFTVVDGFVSLIGSEVEPAIKSIDVDVTSFSDPVPSDPNNGILSITGGQVDGGQIDSVIRTNSETSYGFTIEIQAASASGVNDPTLNGVAHFSNADFAVTTNGFVTARVNVTTPGAYPYTTLQTDDVILVDTSVARTITPRAGAVVGETYRIKDNVGTAAANNITITPSGANIDGAASYVLGVNWASADVVWNGIQWNVV